MVVFVKVQILVMAKESDESVDKLLDRILLIYKELDVSHLTHGQSDAQKKLCIV